MKKWVYGFVFSLMLIIRTTPSFSAVRHLQHAYDRQAQASSQDSGVQVAQDTGDENKNPNHGNGNGGDDNGQGDDKPHHGHGHSHDEGNEGGDTDGDNGNEADGDGDDQGNND